MFKLAGERNRKVRLELGVRNPALESKNKWYRLVEDSITSLMVYRTRLENEWIVVNGEREIQSSESLFPRALRLFLCESEQDTHDENAYPILPVLNMRNPAFRIHV